MKGELRATWSILTAGRGQVRRRLLLVLVLALAVVLIEQASRLLVLSLWPRGTWIDLVGPLAVARADHYTSVEALLLVLRYIVGLPALLFLVAALGHLLFMRTWMTIGIGLIMGGSAANFISLALSGYVANWLAVGSRDRALLYVPADIAQIVGISMLVGGTLSLLGVGIAERWIMTKRTRVSGG
jgi:hypothetical protein